MSYVNTYQMSKTKTNLSQENQLQRQKVHLGPPKYKTEWVIPNGVVSDFLLLSNSLLKFTVIHTNGELSCLNNGLY
jgi:hypothetical protein